MQRISDITSFATRAVRAMFCVNRNCVCDLGTLLGGVGAYRIQIHDCALWSSDYHVWSDVCGRTKGGYGDFEKS